jgi:hypothetical protein
MDQILPRLREIRFRRRVANHNTGFRDAMVLRHFYSRAGLRNPWLLRGLNRNLAESDQERRPLISESAIVHGNATKYNYPIG